MERHAVVDIGSNTVRMNVYDVTSSGRAEPTDGGEIAYSAADIKNNKREFTHLFSEKEMLGIINFIEDGRLSEEGIDKLIHILSSFKHCADSVMSNHFACFATASLRGLVNKDDVMMRIKDFLGVDADLISGEDEALYDFYGIKEFFDLSGKKGLVINIGGGSTEFLTFLDGHPQKSISEPFGSLMLHKKYVSKILPRKNEIAAMTKFLDKKLAKIPWLNDNFDEVFFSGGAGRAVAKVHRLHFGNDFHNTINGYEIKTEDLYEILDYFRANKNEFVKELIKEAPDRIHTVVPGLVLYARVMKLVKSKYVKFSLFGIREGYFIKNILHKTTQK